MSRTAKHSSRHNKPRSKSKVGILIAGALALAGLVAAVVFFNPLSLLGRHSSSSSGDTVRPSELILSLPSNACDATPDGPESTEMPFVVWYDSSIAQDIVVADESGTPLATITPDGSGSYAGILSIPTTTPGFMQLAATSGDVHSEPAIVRIVPTITDDMLQTFASVLDDLSAQLEPLPEEGYTDDQKDALLTWLQADARVEDAVENGDYLLFRTMDGLVGGVQTVPDAPDALGPFHQIPETFSAKESGVDVSGWTIPSETTMTNDKVRLISPVVETDDYIKKYFPLWSSQLERLASALGWQYLPSSSDADGLAQMCDAATLTDSGVLTLTTHGGHLTRGSDGSLLSLLELLHGKYEGVDTIRWGNPFAEDGACYFGTLEYPEANDVLFLLVYDQQDRPAFKTLMTATKFMANVGTSTFDNTIVELLICYAAADQHLVQFLIDHGASAVIGCQESYLGALATTQLESLARTFPAVADDGSYLPLSEVKDSPLFDMEAYAKAVYLEQDAKKPEDVDEYVEAAAARPARYFLAEPGRVAAGMASVSGMVVGLAGENMPDATVTLYRWIDHEFQQVGSVQTDREGHYLLEDCPYGPCYVKAEFLDSKGHTAQIVQKRDVTLDDIVLPIMTVTGRVVDKQTGEPLPHQKVVIGWGEYLMAGETDDAGVYTIHPVTCTEGGAYTATLASDTYSAKSVQFNVESLIEVVTVTDILAEKESDREVLLRHLFEDLVVQEQLVSFDEYVHEGSATDYFDFDPYYQSIDGRIVGAVIGDLDGDDRDEMLVASYDVRANEDPSNMYPDVHLLVRYFDVTDDTDGRTARLLDTVDQIVSPTWRKGVFGAGLAHIEDGIHLVAFGTVYDDFSSSNRYDGVWKPEPEVLRRELGYETFGLGMSYAIDRTDGSGTQRVFERNNQDWESKIDLMQEVQATMYADLDAYGAGSILSSGKVDAAGILETKSEDLDFFALTEIRSEGSGYVGRSCQLGIDALRAEYDELE